MTFALEVEDVVVLHGPVRALDGVRLSVAAGEVIAVAGPSGAGKTTLLRVLLGLSAPLAGAVRIEGRTVSEGGRVLVPPEDRRLSMVFQDLALWPHLTVHGNLAFGLEARGVPRPEREQKIHGALALVGLAGHARRTPGELSGGERQRVALARALVQEPAAILFDEPLSNLDVALKREILGLLRALLGERRLPAIFVTHDPREAAALAARVAILERGRIVQVGTADELLASPATAFTRAFAEEMARG